MSTEKAIIKTKEGKKITITEQTPIPCFRCGVCCIGYQAPVTRKEIDKIASALKISRSKCIALYTLKVPIKEGYLLKRTDQGCVFLAWDVDGKARCSIYSLRPRACREWTPSLSKPECREGLAKLRSRGQIMLQNELFSSPKEQKELYVSLEKVAPQSQHPGPVQIDR